MPTKFVKVKNNVKINSLTPEALKEAKFYRNIIAQKLKEGATGNINLPERPESKRLFNQDYLFIADKNPNGLQIEGTNGKYTAIGRMNDFHFGFNEQTGEIDLFRVTYTNNEVTSDFQIGGFTAYGANELDYNSISIRPDGAVVNISASARQGGKGAYNKLYGVATQVYIKEMEEEVKFYQKCASEAAAQGDERSQKASLESVKSYESKINEAKADYEKSVSNKANQKNEVSK